MAGIRKGLTRHNGATIKAFRVKAGKKPGEFASEVLIAYSTLDNIEKERKEASIEVLHRIAAALQVPVEAIVRDPAVLVEQVAVGATA
jgi:DNA-binding XRE family transcriptional regulator